MEGLEGHLFMKREAACLAYRVDEGWVCGGPVSFFFNTLHGISSNIFRRISYQRVLIRGDFISDGASVISEMRFALMSTLGRCCSSVFH